ncbi:MAG: LPS-assembly protein LptD, partial [Ignavibacteria bacterium]|nr:LPS-assembly protein LptD [Ignavibacteria bacterium]
LFVYILLFTLFSAELFSQNDGKFNSDTSAVFDSTLTPGDTNKFAKSDIDDIIFYNSSDSVVFDLSTDKMYLYNNAEVKYKELQLNSGIIVFSKETQILEALGIPRDSSGVTVTSQLPLMKQGSEKFEGTKLTYSFKTSRGTISMGYSDADVGYYMGEKIKKVTPEIMFIQNGRYTTSTDKVDPEYYFYSPKMKLIPKDKIIAQSAFLYIEGVPVFWIPFVILPNRTGRTSGFLVPSYGTDANYGLYLANAGYFWAINDYLDLALKATVFTKGRYDFLSRFRYAKKYNYDGTLEGGYSMINKGESTDTDKEESNQWLISLVHNQKFTPTASLSGNLTFVSGKSYYDNSTNSLPDLLRQNVVSNLTFSKSWEETPFSMNINYSRDQNLTNGDLNERLPNFVFNVSETYPFREDVVSSEQSLLDNFSFSYNMNALNNRIKLSNVENGRVNVKSGIANRINFNFSPSFKYFNVKPYFYYNEIWYNEYTTKTFSQFDSTVITSKQDAIKAVRYFSTGVTFNTKIIGIFNPKIFNVSGFKHTIEPSITYNFTPDFSTPSWGYYGTYTGLDGNPVKYSFYEGNVFGGAPQGESQSIAIQFGNLFEMKTRVNDSTENKFQLLNFNTGINYNFAADSLNWSDLFADIRTQIGSLLNIGSTASFTLYDFDPVKKTRINDFLINTKGKLLELSNFNFNASSTFSFGIISSGSTGDSSYDSLKINKSTYRSPYEEPDINVPISGTINYNFSENRQNPTQIFKTNNLSASLNLNPTPKWKLSFSTSYDLINKMISAPYITVYRDLNSWEINFNWYPVGTYRGFFFQIRIKAPQLQDIKVTKQTNTRGVY